MHAMKYIDAMGLFPASGTSKVYILSSLCHLLTKESDARCKPHLDTSASFLGRGMRGSKAYRNAIGDQ